MSVIVVRCVSCDRFLGRVKLVEGSRYEVFCSERRCKCLTCLEIIAGAVTITRAEKRAPLLSSIASAAN